MLRSYSNVRPAPSARTPKFTTKTDFAEGSANCLVRSWFVAFSSKWFWQFPHLRFRCHSGPSVASRIEAPKANYIRRGRKRCKEPPPRADNTSTQRRKKRAAYPADYDHGLSLSKVRKPISVENIDDGNDGKQDAEESEPTRHLLVANKHKLLPRMNITSPVQRLTPTGVRRTGF